MKNNTNINIEPLNNIKNHFILMEDPSVISDRSIFQLERDPMFPGDTLSAVGRFSIFQVLNPIKNSRFKLSLSSSYTKNEDFKLPPVKIIGDSMEALPIIGRGSARVISQAIDPIGIEGFSFMGLDFGRDAHFIDRNRSGVMNLFGSRVKFDARKVVAYARDISYIDNMDFITIVRPSFINTFPDSLLDPSLEYSGIFEDGWISESCYVILRSPKEGENLYLKFQIPQIKNTHFSTKINIKINNELMYSHTHEVGDSNIVLRMHSNSLNKKSLILQIDSSQLQRLPNGDDRPVSVHLDSISFK